MFFHLGPFIQLSLLEAHAFLLFLRSLFLPARSLAWLVEGSCKLLHSMREIELIRDDDEVNSGTALVLERSSCSLTNYSNN